MKIETFQRSKSSFLSLEKDLSIIVNKLLKNEDLKRLLYYEDKHCLSAPNLTEEQTIGLINKNIKIVPKLQVDSEALNYVIITFDNFVTNDNNPEFRDCTITFDIICHMDQWNLGDFKLRPYRIAGEIDSMLDNKRLTGIGTLNFLSANQIVLNSELSGVSLSYLAIYGEEDKI